MCSLKGFAIKLTRSRCVYFGKFRSQRKFCSLFLDLNSTRVSLTWNDKTYDRREQVSHTNIFLIGVYSFTRDEDVYVTLEMFFGVQYS